MNEKWFALPAAKRRAVLRAGWRVFGANSYKKASMQAIADEAGVSKSLLFHYFRNKRELYLYLWDRAARATEKALAESGCYDAGNDLFTALERGMHVKLGLMQRAPEMGAFAVRAFYEKDPAVAADIQKSCAKYIGQFSLPWVLALEPAQFRPGLDLEMMYKDMYWAAAGYVWELQQRGSFDLAEVRAGFARLVDFWRGLYARRPEEAQG